MLLRHLWASIAAELVWDEREPATLILGVSFAYYLCMDDVESSTEAVVVATVGQVDESLVLGCL